MTLDTKTVYANSKTVFLVQTGTGSKATYKSYTGLCQCSRPEGQQRQLCLLLQER